MTEDSYKGTISMHLVHEALQVAYERKLDISSILQKAGIEEGLLNVSKTRVTAIAYARLWAVLADVMDDEFFGMDQHPMRRGSYSLMCHSVLGCETLGHALQRILKFLRLVLDDLEGQVIVDGESYWIRLSDRGGIGRMFAYATWFMLVHGLACWLVGQRISLLEASFRCAEPCDVTDYRVRFSETAVFNAPFTQIRIDRKAADLKVIANKDSVRSFLRGAPANVLVKYRNDLSMSSAIRRQLRSLPAEEWPELVTLARSMCMSSPTLQRRLQNEGLSYQRVKDELRRDIAIELLTNSKFSILDISTRVGFQETSAFYRAFKKWVGVSPGAYRHHFKESQ